MPKHQSITPTASEQHQPGRLIVVLGASGSGKDTLIRYVRERVTEDDKVLFAHRYITRPAHVGGENHISLSSDEFQLRLSAGLFALDWTSHGYRYAVGNEVNSWLASGFNVVVNGSRAHLAETLASFDNALVVRVDTSTQHLRRRLEKRQRENEKEVAGRLERAERYAMVDCPGIVVLNNDGPVDHAGERMLRLCRLRLDSPAVAAMLSRAASHS